MIGSPLIKILSSLSLFSKILLCLLKLESDALPEYLITANYPSFIVDIFTSGFVGEGTVSSVNFEGK